MWGRGRGPLQTFRIYTYSKNSVLYIIDINTRVIDWDVKEIFVKSTGKQYMLRLDNNKIYDYDSVIQAKKTPGVAPILLGKLVKTREGNYEIIRDRS